MLVWLAKGYVYYTAGAEANPEEWRGWLILWEAPGDSARLISGLRGEPSFTIIDGNGRC